MSNKVPILLVTGFLGSGKTTFLNWLIHTHPDLKISLILNEFGDVKLESQFIKQTGGGEVTELANGCMCCVAKNDIPRVINYILDNSPHTQYILIEASGLSDPDPIHEALQTPQLMQRSRLDAILCIVDAINFSKTRQEHPIVMSQIGDADMILLSKVAEAESGTVEHIKNLLTKIGTGTKVIEFTKDLDPRLFLDPDVKSSGNKYDKINQSENDHSHQHEQIQEYWFKTEKEIDLQKLIEVMKNIPQSIIRAKGIINSQNKKYLLQYVGTKLDIAEQSWGMFGKHQTAILFLGTQFDENALKTQLQSTELV